ncbi:Mor transcription activator family protein [Enterocloster clostridioformis]|uniref:Mor transcription activator family protein n=1 Tax=Enterocloster clostridioformis TaxID=1531 RepID=UPI00156E5998|nr:Mor transcription activator family protein [Enterocloster clostridioformis]NSJ57437.1 Mor transcription activator family protein [Enterocloster clostridioformis]
MLNISFALSFHSIGRSTFPVHTYILTPNFRGQQVVFPNKLYSSAYTAQKIREEFNGKNVKELALKYGFTEIWVRTLLKTGNERI